MAEMGTTNQDHERKYMFFKARFWRPAVESIGSRELLARNSLGLVSGKTGC